MRQSVPLSRPGAIMQATDPLPARRVFSDGPGVAAGVIGLSGGIWITAGSQQDLQFRELLVSQRRRAVKDLPDAVLGEPCPRGAARFQGLPLPLLFGALWHEGSPGPSAGTHKTDWR